MLARPKFDRYQSANARRGFAAIVRRHAALFTVSKAIELNLQLLCRNPKDNKFLALVQACDADALVSNDANLAVLHPWQGVPILTPAGFLAMAKT